MTGLLLGGVAAFVVCLGLVVRGFSRHEPVDVLAGAAGTFVSLGFVAGVATAWGVML